MERNSVRSSTFEVNRHTLAARQIAFECQIPSPGAASQSFDWGVKGVLERGSHGEPQPQTLAASGSGHVLANFARPGTILIQVDEIIFALVSFTHKFGYGLSSYYASSKYCAKLSSTDPGAKRQSPSFIEPYGLSIAMFRSAHNSLDVGSRKSLTRAHARQVPSV